MHTFHTQRPRNEEAIREKMISMMKKAKFVPSGQTATHVDYSMDTMLLFDEFVDMAMVRGPESRCQHAHSHTHTLTHPHATHATHAHTHR